MLLRRLTKFFTLTFYFPKINSNITLLSVSGLSLLGIFHSNFRPLFSFPFLCVTMEQTEFRDFRTVITCYFFSKFRK